MSSSGYLVAPSSETDEAQEKLWTETWKRIDRFLPDLKKELDLDPKEKEKEKPVVVEKLHQAREETAAAATAS